MPASALPVQKTLLPVVLTNEENSVSECQVEITASMLLLMSTLPTNYKPLAWQRGDEGSTSNFV